jgi:hypothetical protein
LQDPPKFTQIVIFGLKKMPSGNPELEKHLEKAFTASVTHPFWHVFFRANI